MANEDGSNNGWAVDDSATNLAAFESLKNALSSQGCSEVGVYTNFGSW